MRFYPDLMEVPATPLWVSESLERFEQLTASRSSHPSHGRNDRTFCSCLSHTPGLLCSLCGRHCYRRHQDRHNHPHPRHRGSQECNIFCPALKLFK